MDSVCSTSFEVESYIKGYHAYKDIWVPEINEKLQARMEPENLMDKYAVCILKGDNQESDMFFNCIFKLNST